MVTFSSKATSLSSPERFNAWVVPSSPQSNRQWPIGQTGIPGTAALTMMQLFNAILRHARLRISFPRTYYHRFNMSTKTIEVLNAAELKDGEMYVHHPNNLFLRSHQSHRKEVSFEDGKVLLSRLGDKIHATSAYCTHYGAPLAKGVLTSDGRVVWQVHSS